MTQNDYPAHEGLQVVPSDGIECRNGGANIQPDVNNEKILGSPPDVNNEKIVGSQPNVNDEKIPSSPSISRKGYIYGLKRRTFGIIVAIVIALVVVGAVVGGVVGSRSKHSTSSKDPSPGRPTVPGSSTAGPSSTSSQSSSTTAQNAYPTTALKLDCPAINGTTRTVSSSSATSQSHTFNIFCNANFAVGDDSAGRNASSLNDCLESCLDIRELGGTCVGVIWDSIMNLALKPPHNCFLKSSKRGFVYTKQNEVSAAALFQK